MRATALLHLPHASDTEPRLRHGRRRARKRAAGAHATELHAEPTSGHDLVTDPRSTGPQIVQRVRSAGGPVDNASYTCSCGFVFAASVSTTVACPHCGASQAW